MMWCFSLTCMNVWICSAAKQHYLGEAKEEIRAHLVSGNINWNIAIPEDLAILISFKFYIKLWNNVIHSLESCILCTISQ